MAYCRIIGWSVNGELEGTWKKEVVGCFEILNLYLPGSDEEKH
jgi:hypothetical protein